MSWFRILASIQKRTKGSFKPLADITSWEKSSAKAAMLHPLAPFLSGVDTALWIMVLKLKTSSWMRIVKLDVAMS